MNKSVSFERSVVRFSDAESMAAALADAIVARLSHGVSRRDTAGIVASGGILIRGEEKMNMLQAAMTGADASEKPVRAVLHQSAIPVEVYWSP